MIVFSVQNASPISQQCALKHTDAADLVKRDVISEQREIVRTHWKIRRLLSHFHFL